ncbi:MAG: acetate--CoA ligase family protein [Deltaproteobacteria bacterium]|nr:acetate--CoA ligase family protein [Deltaproteobacteria bacterium]
MRTLFYPQSVMVVGVSIDRFNLGKQIVDNLGRFGFQGPVYPVGHEGGELNGRKISQRIEDVDAVPELAVFLIPARYIPDALDVCGEKGIRYAVIESAGFNEYGGVGTDLKQKVLDVAEKWGIRFVGPNCISIINLENGLTLPFVPLDPSMTKRGHVSVVAQSGGVIFDGIRLFGLENIGFDKLISMGNKLDLNENDYLDFLVSDPGTHIIGLYLEDISDGRALMNHAFQTEKPILVLKANTNASSSTVAQFHTAALAGDDQVADAALRQAGLLRVQNMQELMDCFKIFSLPLMKGSRLAVLCRSGGQAVLFADATHRHGFELAQLSDGFFEMVKKETRAGVIRMTNPLDLGDVFDVNIHIGIMERALQEEEVDGLIFGHLYVSEMELKPTEKLIQAARSLSLRYGKPVVFAMISEKELWVKMKHMADFPIFHESDYALKALSISYRHFRNRSRIAGRKRHVPLLEGKTQEDSSRQSEMMHPGETFNVLKSYDLPVTDFRIVKTAEEGLRAAEEIGYPVVLKIAAPPILHKTEAGGVRLNISGQEDLERVFREMEGDEYLIQKMATPGREVIIGGKQDNEFGPVVLFGLGGVFVEVLKDTAIRVAPIDKEEAGIMIEEIKGARLLDDFRGQPPADKETLVQCLVKVSHLLFDHPEIKNLDINPMIVGDEGEGCMIVDAKIERIAFP